MKIATIFLASAIWSASAFEFAFAPGVPAREKQIVRDMLAQNVDAHEVKDRGYWTEGVYRFEWCTEADAIGAPKLNGQLNDGETAIAWCYFRHICLNLQYRWTKEHMRAALIREMGAAGIAVH